MIGILIACIIAVVLIVWLKTDGIIEWAKIFGLKKLLKIDEYYDYKIEQYLNSEHPMEVSYPLFLKMTNNNFLTRLLSCPLCLGFWLSVLGCAIISNLIAIPIIYVVSMLLYGAILKLVVRT